MDCQIQIVAEKKNLTRLQWMNLRNKRLDDPDLTSQSTESGDTFQVKSTGVVPA